MSRQSRRAQQVTAIFMVSVLAGWVLVPLRAGSGNLGQGTMPASGQRPGGAYANVRKWYLGYRVIIETGGLREVRSKELSKHGIPVDIYKYSIKREYFVLSMPLTGPIPGMEFPNGKGGTTTLTKEELRQNPMLALQNIMNFVGWTVSGTDSLKKVSSQVSVDIEDVLEHDSSGDDECSSEFRDVIHKETFSYHGSVVTDFAVALLGFDLKNQAYALQVRTQPTTINASASMVVKKHIEDNIVSGGGDTNGPQQEHHVTDSVVSLNTFRDIETPALSFDGLLLASQHLPSGVTNQIKVSKKESPVRVTSFPQPVIDDILKNGTVTVTIKYVIQQKEIDRI